MRELIIFLLLFETIYLHQEGKFIGCGGFEVKHIPTTKQKILENDENTPFYKRRMDGKEKEYHDLHIYFDYVSLNNQMTKYQWSTANANMLTNAIKKAIKTAKQSGYGIVYPTLKEMKLDTPEIVKQGNRFGVKLKATASSYHIIKADVESVFEPIIGSELQSKELINYLMKDYESDPTNIWRSEIFGRGLDTIVKEGIQAKLAVIPENTRYKLSQTVTKIVNKGASNLIAIVL